MNNALQSISFHQDTIFVIDHNGEPFVPVRPLSDNMGLDWASQYRKLMAQKKRFCVYKMTTQLPGDNQAREVICIPLRKTFGWISTISPTKVAPHLKEKIEIYQNECDEVLWNYWTKGMAVSDKVAAEYTMIKIEDKVHLLEYYHNGRGKMSAPAVTTAESAAMKQDILAGMTTAQVAKKHGRAKSTVQQHTKVERRQVEVKKSGQMLLPFAGGNA